MSGFGSTLNVASNALSVIQRALDAVQNNVVNANTPGFAAENVSFTAQSFNLSSGSSGGVQLELSSTRDQYLEQSVRGETSALGLATQQSALLDSLQSSFSASGNAGIPGALSNFTASFANLSTDPSSASAQAAVVAAAATLAQSFNQAATGISQLSSQATQGASSTVNQINVLATHIASLNAHIQSGAQADAGVAADLNQSLESLSSLVNISVSYAQDGSASVLLGGQTPLVLGSTANALGIQNQPVDPASSYPNALPDIRLVTQDGTDVTAQATQGELGAFLSFRNQTIPQYLGDSSQQGSLNTLATTFANRVNQILSGGQIASTGAPGTNLFTYSALTDTSAAMSLSVVPGFTADQIATVDPGPPVLGNGVALELANLTNPTNPADLIVSLGSTQSESFASYYGQLAGQAGSASSQATAEVQTQQDLTTQAQNLRTQASGVSLNAQAAQLLTLQQAFQATAKLVSVLDTLSQAAINMIPQT